MSKDRGYVLFDVLLALFLFSVGFAALFSLTEGAFSEARQAAGLLEGANLAQEMMDGLTVRGWRENIASGDCLPGGAITGQGGSYHWTIRTEWEDIPNLLRVTIDVSWSERGKISSYKLESLYVVE